MSYNTPKEIPQTSCAQGEPDPPSRSVTVKFNRWTAIGETAYQKDQYAGFSEEIAQRIVRSGSGRIVLRT